METDLAKITGGVGIALLIGILLVMFGLQFGLPSFVSLGGGIEAFAYFGLFLGIVFALGEVFEASFVPSVAISFVITGIAYLVVSSV